MAGVRSRGKTIVQGCWLDWDKLQQRLREEVDDLELPAVTFLPVTDSAALDQNHLLATFLRFRQVPRRAGSW